MTKKEIEDNYAISRRIEAEERALETATMVLTSTQQEIDEQWGLYDGYGCCNLCGRVHISQQTAVREVPSIAKLVHSCLRTIMLVLRKKKGEKPAVQAGKEHRCPSLQHSMEVTSPKTGNRCRYDVKLEAVLRARRRAGRMMPLINVIPPGLDFSSLKVDLPMDPAQGAKPPPKHASFSAHHSNPCSPRSADGSSPHGEPRLSDVGSPGDGPHLHTTWFAANMLAVGKAS